MEPLEYAELPERAKKTLFDATANQPLILQFATEIGEVAVRASDKDGDIETLDNISFTHNYVHAPGDYDMVRWHYVTAGDPENAKDRTIVFLHGIPDSWYMWHHTMASLSGEYYCIGIDLKGFGQSGKEPGDYRSEGVAEQLHEMLQTIRVSTYYLVSHDRGVVVADFLAAHRPESVLGYARCEQTMYHFNPMLSRHLDMFRDAPYNGILDDSKQVVLMAYIGMSKDPNRFSKSELIRLIQEFSYPGIDRALPRYLNSTTTEQEWKHRRRALLEQWRCPVVLIQGTVSRTQPREFFEGVEKHIPNAEVVRVRFVEDAGHFFPMERPEQATEEIRKMLEVARSVIL